VWYFQVPQSSSKTLFTLFLVFGTVMKHTYIICRFSRNIWNTRDSVSSGYPNTEIRNSWCLEFYHKHYGIFWWVPFWRLYSPCIATNTIPVLIGRWYWSLYLRFNGCWTTIGVVCSSGTSLIAEGLLCLSKHSRTPHTATSSWGLSRHYQKRNQRKIVSSRPLFRKAEDTFNCVVRSAYLLWICIL